MLSIEKRAFFIIPPTGLYLRDRCQVALIEDMMAQDARPPMDLAYMAAVLERQGFICKICDYPVERKKWKEAEKDIRQFLPTVLIISTTPATILSDLEACRIAKETNDKVVTIAKGGYEISTILKASPFLDIMIHNEPESVIEEIVSGEDYCNIKGISYKRGKDCFSNEERAFLSDLDTLPQPARHLLKNKLYVRPDTKEAMGVVLLSKGCPEKCIFCPTSLFSGSIVRKRVPEKIIEEIDNCIQEFGIRNFLFQTDNFAQDKKWAIELCHLIIKKGFKIEWGCTSRADMLDKDLLDWMKKAGCWVISLGIETGNPDLLQKSKKGMTIEQARQAVMSCKDAGIRIFLYFIIGLPWETEKTIRDSVDFAKELDADFYEFHVAYPFAGTEFYRIAKDKRLIREEYLYTGSYGKPVIDSLFLSGEQLSFYRKKALLEIYLRFKYIGRILTNIRSFRQLMNYFYFGAKKITALLWS